MVMRSCSTQYPKRTPTTRDIRRVWRADRSVRASTAQQYLQWIGRFRRYCNALGLDEVDELTRDGVGRFLFWYANSRTFSAGYLSCASSALRSLHRVYEVIGTPVPPWKSVECRPAPATAILRDYAAHLRQHRGNPEVTIRKKLDHVGKLLEHLRCSGKTWRQLNLHEIDAFLIACTRRYARSTKPSRSYSASYSGRR
jgi:integrase/recombinase XerD